LEERLLDADAALSDALKSNKSSHKAAAAAANDGRPGGTVFFTDEHDPTATPPAAAKLQSLPVVTAAATTEQPAAATAADPHHRVPSAWGPAPAKGDADGTTISEGAAATPVPGRATATSTRPASAAFAASTRRGVEQQSVDDANDVFEVASVGDSEVSSSGEDEMAFADPSPMYTHTAPSTHIHVPAPPVYHRAPEPPHRALDFSSHAVTEPHHNKNAPGAGGRTVTTATATTAAVRDEFDEADPLLQRVALTGGAPPVVASAVLQQQQQQQQQQPDYAKTVFAPRPNLNSVPGLLNNTSELLQEVRARVDDESRTFTVVRCCLGKWLCRSSTPPGKLALASFERTWVPVLCVIG
jgi:hypothetical protein